MIEFKYNVGNSELTCIFLKERIAADIANQLQEIIKAKLAEIFAEDVDSQKTLRVVFDLGKVDYISSFFLRIVGMSAKKLEKDNLVVTNTNNFIRDIFKVSGMERVLDAVVKRTVEETYPPSEAFQAQAHIKSMAEYQAMHKQSLDDPDTFWGDLAKEHIQWNKPFEKILNWQEPYAKWFENGSLNVCENCVDKHLQSGKADKTAILWEGEPENEEVRNITYRELHQEVCKFANVLKAHNIGKGDRVLIYMPMVPEVVFAMLACARLGAIHSVVFAGFSPQAIAERVADSEAKVVLTTDGSYRRGKVVPLKDNVDQALTAEGNTFNVSSVQSVIVLNRTGNEIKMQDDRDSWWNAELEKVDADCPVEYVDSEDELFILYTSGSTGKPKGVVHTSAGYLLGTKVSHHYVFDLKDDDVYWCTADVGWITGHSYIVYGPLANGSTVFMYEGAPNFPDFGRFWKLIEKHQISIFYTAPTAIRAFMQWGNEWPNKYDLSSLRLLGTVGEPINPQAWKWYNEFIGKNRCPIVDTWWQTETGGIMIAGLPGAATAKPGSASFPFFGIDPAIVDDLGKPVDTNENGVMIIRKPWPSMLRGIWKNPERYQATYWTDIPGNYFTGDSARLDEEGYFWIIGRVDDVINVSGHRIGTAEIESALISHSTVAEAAAVGRPDDIKGSVLVVFVNLMPDVDVSDDLRSELRKHVGHEIGAVARPEEIRFVDALPKTRSGKIMRRFLKQVAAGTDITGDITTLEDLSVLTKLVGD
jgi:acetyl-CoA synthetase